MNQRKGWGVLLGCSVGLIAACTPQVAPTTALPAASTSTLIPATVTATPIPPTAIPTESGLPAPDQVRTSVPVPTALATESADPVAALLARDSIAAELVRLAREQVARETNLATQRVRVIDVTAVVWTDSALNCPLPDAVVLPMVIDGYRILLRAGEREFLFHTDIDRITRCDPAHTRPVDGEATPELTPELTADATP